MAMSGVQADGSIFQEAAYQNYLTFVNNTVTQSAPLALHDDLNKTGLFVASADHPTPFLLYGDGHMLDGGDGVEIASQTAHLSQESIQDVLDTGTTKITKDRIQSRFPTSACTESKEVISLQDWATSPSLVARAQVVFKDVHDVIIRAVKPNVGPVSMDLNGTYRLKLRTKSGRQGYFGWTSPGWGWIVDQDAATKLKIVYDGANYFTTLDGWWLSVGAVGANNGYVGFYYQHNRGSWTYDPATKRLKSGVNDAVMSMRDGDNYIYCWSGYDAIDVELEAVEPAPTSAVEAQVLEAVGPA